MRRRTPGRALIAVLTTASLGVAVGGCGTSQPVALNASQQATLGSAVGYSVVRCKFASLGGSAASAQDPDISSSLTAVATLYKRVGPHAKVGKETMGQAVHQMIGKFSCAPALAQILITATGGSPHAAAKAARAQGQAEYAKCNGQLGSLITAESTLNGHLDVGMNYTEYISAVGDVRTAYNAVSVPSLGPQCLPIGVHTENALNDYVKAANVWENCFGNANCSNDSIKPQLQAQWSKAGSQLQQAQSALKSIQSAG